MKTKPVASQVLKFNKMAFDSTFETMTILQDQIEKAVNRYLEYNNAMIPEEGKAAVSKWIEAYKKGRLDFKRAADENYKNVEKFFSDLGNQKKD